MSTVLAAGKKREKINIARGIVVLLLFILLCYAGKNLIR
jgi:hypothetical protein